MNLTVWTEFLLRSLRNTPSHLIGLIEHDACTLFTILPMRSEGGTYHRSSSISAYTYLRVNIVNPHTVPASSFIVRRLHLDHLHGHVKI